MLSTPDWLETLETDRSGDRVSIVGGCFGAAPGVGLGLVFELDRGLGLGLGLFLVLAGAGDRGFEGVLGVRGILGVGSR